MRLRDAPPIPRDSPAPIHLDFIQMAASDGARRIGALFDVHLAVGRREREFVFLDGKGGEIIDPGGETAPKGRVVCATFVECRQGLFPQLFPGRAIYAAMILRMADLDRAARAANEH